MTIQRLSFLAFNVTMAWSGTVEGKLANPARSGRKQRQYVFLCRGSLILTNCNRLSFKDLRKRKLRFQKMIWNSSLWESL